LFDFAHERAITKHRRPQLHPILPTPAGDHIIDPREGVSLMIELAMEHGDRYCYWV